MKFTMKKQAEDTVPGKYWNRIEKKLWLGTLLCGCTMLYAARTVMPLCVVTMSQEFSWDKTDTGAVLSAFFWGYTMTQVLGGYISDRIGGDTVLTTAAVGWALLTFWTPHLLYLSSSKSLTLAIVVASRVIMGCLQGVHYPSMTSILTNKVPEASRSLGYAFAASGSYVGALFCGSAGSYLLEHWGWQSPFYGIGFLAMAWVLFMRYYLIAKQRRKAKVLSVETMAPVAAPHDIGPVPWLLFFKSPPFWAVLVAHFCGNNAFFILLSWLPTYFKENYPDGKGWVYNVMPWLVAIPASVFSGWWADSLIQKGHDLTFVRKLMETIALGGMGLFLLVVSYIQHYEIALFCMAGAMTCWGFHTSGVLVNTQDLAPKYSGSVFGIMNTVGAIPGFLGVYIVGHILETTHSWAAVFTQTSIICYVGLAVYILFGSARKLV